MGYARKIAFYHNGPQTDKFFDKNWVNSTNFNATIFKLTEKFDHQFSHVFIFGNMFPESHCFFAIPVTSCIKDSCSNLSPSNWWREMKLFDLVTGTATKPWPSGDMSPNLNTCENGWSNFSENVRIVTLTLFELTLFTSPNQSMYLNFVRCYRSVVMLTF